jgi:GWxTD domain-containing protein
MRHFSKIILLCLVIISSVTASDTKEIFHFKNFRTDIPRKMPLLVRTYPVYRGEGTFQLYFLIEIQNDFLQFIYDGESYKADAELEIDLKNASTNELKSQIFHTQAQEADFESTNGRDLYHFVMDSFMIESGEYEVTIKYSDVNGKGRQQSQKFKIRLPSVNTFYASPILFAYPGKEVQDKTFHSQPSALRSYWDFNRKMGIQMNTWQSPPDTTVNVKIEIIETPKGQSIYSVDTLLTGSAQNKSAYFALSENLFSEGEFLIKVSYATLNDTVDQKFPLHMIWFEKPLSLWDINSAIGPLKYVIKDEKAFEDLNSGNEEEKQVGLDGYWKEQDPTPGTPFNELEYEFYSRVDSANAKYGRRGVPGWTTDVGKIYILYGVPDEVVDNSLAPISNPFLRWIYYLEGKRLSFTFLALDGRKRYKLADVEENPIQ